MDPINVSEKMKKQYCHPIVLQYDGLIKSILCTSGESSDVSASDMNYIDGSWDD